MTKWTKTKKWLPTGLALAALAACGPGGGSDLEVRTISVTHLQAQEAAQLIDPYVYGNRPDNPGMVSISGSAISVRETPDNLDQIERVLAEFDQPRSDARLQFQLIEAGDFEGGDASLEALEGDLRSVLQFRGYRLAGEAFVSTTDGSEFQARVQGPERRLYWLSGHVWRLAAETYHVEDVRLTDANDFSVILTTVNIRHGQTLVIGSAPAPGSNTTLLLTVRAEAATGPA